MENLLRKHDLVNKTGRYTELSEQRRDVLASLLTEKAEVPRDMNRPQFAQLLLKKWKEHGLGEMSLASVTTYADIERYKQKFVLDWISGKRIAKKETVAYALPMWDLLHKKWPYNGGPATELEAEPEELPSYVTTPELAGRPEPLDPTRYLAEEHSRLFKEFADSYVPVFSQLIRRLEKLERIAEDRLKPPPPVIPPEAAAQLPESTKRYFEFEMPETGAWGFVFRYTERFRRSYKKMDGSLHWQVVRALEMLASKGMRYPGLGTTKLHTMHNRQMDTLRREECALFHMRVQRTWRIIFNVNSKEKIYWIEVVASHDDKQFYAR